MVGEIAAGVLLLSQYISMVRENTVKKWLYDVNIVTLWLTLLIVNIAHRIWKAGSCDKICYCSVSRDNEGASERSSE